MAKGFVWLSDKPGDPAHDTSDPNWTLEKAQKRGLIREGSGAPVVISATPPPSAAMLQHMKDCRHAVITGSNSHE